MNNGIETPETVDGFHRLLKTSRASKTPLTIAGALSKLRLDESETRAVVSSTGYSGIVDHQASDFTITARAGTPVREVMNVLDEAGQFLPFDPVFADRSATIGGMIATGINGPCRMKYGGLRDFVIGCQFMDGMGNVIRAGGKVVKNAAGFDLPKFLVGSAGKFGLLLEATFKVFPRPSSYQTLVTGAVDIDTAINFLRKLLESRIDFDAIDILESGRIAVRWSGEHNGEHDRIVEACGVEAESLDGDNEKTFWNDLANFADCNSDSRIVRVPITRNQIAVVDQRLSRLALTRRFSAAGNLAIIDLPNEDDVDALGQQLLEMGLDGQVVVGKPDQFLLGAITQLPFLKRIKSALDPECVFGPIERPVGVAR